MTNPIILIVLGVCLLVDMRLFAGGLIAIGIFTLLTTW